MRTISTGMGRVMPFPNTGRNGAFTFLSRQVQYGLTAQYSICFFLIDHLGKELSYQHGRNDVH